MCGAGALFLCFPSAELSHLECLHLSSRACHLVCSPRTVFLHFSPLLLLSPPLLLADIRGLRQLPPFIHVMALRTIMARPTATRGLNLLIVCPPPAERLSPCRPKALLSVCVCVRAPLMNQCLHLWLLTRWLRREFIQEGRERWGLGVHELKIKQTFAWRGAGFWGLASLEIMVADVVILFLFWGGRGVKVR